MPAQAISARLFGAIQSGRAPHAILITGPKGCGANGLARSAAALFLMGSEEEKELVNCPDYFELGPESILVDEIRSLQAALAERSFSGRRAVVFLDAHVMNASAQNALLKTLEEPPDGTILLLAGQQAGLLPTIRSRCALVLMGRQTKEEIFEILKNEPGVDEHIAAFAAWLSDGAVEAARELCAPEYLEFYNQAAALFLRVADRQAPDYQKLEELLNFTFTPGKDGRSKAARQRPNARLCLDMWLAMCRDMLLCRYTAPENGGNPLFKQCCGYAQRFTISQIQGIIELLFNAQTRLTAASPSLTMDVALTGLDALLANR